MGGPIQLCGSEIQRIKVTIHFQAFDIRFSLFKMLQVLLPFTYELIFESMSNNFFINEKRSRSNAGERQNFKKGKFFSFFNFIFARCDDIPRVDAGIADDGRFATKSK